MGMIRGSAWVRCGLPGLLAGVALAAILCGWRGSSVHAQAPAPGAAGSGPGTFAFTSAGPGTSQFLYLVDTRAQSFAVYRVDPQGTKGTLKLEAARQYRWDMMLAEYNNQPPEVGAVESMVRSTGTAPGAR